MKARALVPALALAAALLAPPLTEAGSRHRSDRGRRPTAHGYYGQRPSRGPSYRSSYRYHGYGYRTPRPYYRTYRYYAAPYSYDDYDYDYGYGYGYGGYGYDYGYGHYPPPPPRYCPPRPRVRFWFGF